MKKYLTQTEAVIDMHKNGFTNDFKLLGKDLLWIQGKTLINSNEFSVLEFHHVINPVPGGDDILLFGILATAYNEKGILLSYLPIPDLAHN